MRWIPGSTGWVWRLENVIFGQRKIINLYAQIVGLSEPACSALDFSNRLGSCIYSETDGLQVWFVKSGDLQEVHRQLRATTGIDFINYPRISTADGISASMYVGNPVSLNGVTNEVGVIVDFFPRVRNRLTDLFATVTFSEMQTNQSGAFGSSPQTNLVSIQTNLNISARLQIPKGSGVLFLKRNDADPGNRAQTNFAMVIDPP